MNHQPTLISALLNQDIPYTPIWLMRQAGRYLPEYRKLRESAGSFLNLCKNPDLATQVTLQPLQRFNLDAAILFSDILVIPEAMGLNLNFVENEGPKFSNPIKNNRDIDNLSIQDVIPKLDFVFQAIKQIKANTKSPLIGFSGSPFTLACYMLEGGSSKDYQLAKNWLYNNPIAMHKLLAILTEAIIKYLNSQIEAGVDVVMVFDSWGGVLSEASYHEFSLKYNSEIINKLHKIHQNRTIPNILFTKGGNNWIKEITQAKSNAIGIDWTSDIGKIRSSLGPNPVLQGNLDPILLAIGDKGAIKAEVNRILTNYKIANNGSIKGHVFNLGHGIVPNTNPDNVAYLIDLVHELSSI